MDWKTVGTLLLGAGISLTTTVVVEEFRNRRDERRRFLADQRATIERIQDVLITIASGLFEFRRTIPQVRDTITSVRSLRDTMPPMSQADGMIESYHVNLAIAHGLASRLVNPIAVRQLDDITTAIEVMNQQIASGVPWHQAQRTLEVSIRTKISLLGDLWQEVDTWTNSLRRPFWRRLLGI